MTREEAIEMLAQHLVTKPVFDALFEGYDFAAHNPVSQAMQNVLAVLEPQNIQKEAASLESFYDSVKRRASGIDNAEGKQKIIVELYDKFFKTAFPKLTEKLGIVYTPVEVVDFIIHSVNDILQQEFGQTLGSEGVHILDPFTGTGTFITRLLQSGLISADELERKYRHEIHANEIVLLAYYIAAINIEAVYHTLSGNPYEPFEGICLTDTFKMYESEDMVAALMQDNSARRTRQKALDIRVILGNPPYNVANTGVEYPHLNKRVSETYAKSANSTLKGALYDSYIQAIRWASDRVGNSGVIGFVTNSGWVEKAFASGMRKCISEEFSSVHVVNLRGDIRKNMLSKGAAQEGENVFAQGSMTGTAITFFVKSSNQRQCKISYHDIGDGLRREAKLSKLSLHKSIFGIDSSATECITPDEHNDWIGLRDASFEAFPAIANKDKTATDVIFVDYSNGIKTAADKLMYGASARDLTDRAQLMVQAYNEPIERARVGGVRCKITQQAIDDETRVNWHAGLIAKAERGTIVLLPPKGLTEPRGLSDR